MSRTATAAALLVGASAALAAAQSTATLAPEKDSTIYQYDANVSNSRGEYTFAGRTRTGDIRRALIQFDIDGAIPAGAQIQSVTLRLEMTRTVAPDTPVRLHRVLESWGEGASRAEGAEGTGAPAAPGDATWLHRFYPDTQWSTAGGSFSATDSGQATVGGVGPYTWASTPAMVADVQSWLDNPSTNFGWMIVGDETLTPSAKRFCSRENSIPASRPVLTVTYGVSPCSGQARGDSNCDTFVNFDDIDCFVAALTGQPGWAACGAASGCTYACTNDINGDGLVNFDDIDGFVGCLAAGSCP